MYSKINTRLHFKWVLAFLLLFFSASENFSVFSKEKSDKISLNSSDNKKLEKAAKELQKSKDVSKEADKIYEEIATKQADLTAEESEKLNNKALSKQIEALKIQQSSNKMKFEVYSAKADEFWKNYKGNADDMAYAKSLESGARLSFQSSEEQYKDAEKGEDKLLIYSSMTSASDMSNKAVEDLKKAFDIYSNTPYEGAETATTNSFQPVKDTVTLDTVKKEIATVETKDTSQKSTGFTSPNIYQAVKVNENMIDQFNKFIQEKYPKDYEKYIVDFSSLDYSDVNALRDAWDNYLYGSSQNPETSLAQADSTKKTDSLTLANNSQTDSLNVNSGGTDKSNSNNINSSKNSSDKSDNSKTAKSKKWKIKRSATDYSQSDSSLTTSSGYTNKYSRYEGASGFQYRVQIVASRVPMSNDGLRLIYDGSEQPEETYENEWYKYSIGPFSTFAQARQFRTDCAVKGAFVVAYLNGKKINPDQELVNSNQNSNSFTNFNKEADLVYKVQVAACRNEMTADELKLIYENAEQLEKSFEDNWYKYLIDSGNDYNHACSLLKDLRIAGAFIAIYRNGTRISLK